MTVATPAVAVIAPIPAVEHVTSGRSADEPIPAPPFPQPPHVTRGSPPETTDPALPPPIPQSGEVAYTPAPAGDAAASVEPAATPPARRAVHP